MYRGRLIPFLLIKDGELVKTVNFKDKHYIGDPVNAIRIFNEFMIDELAIFDIGSSSPAEAPDFREISRLISFCDAPVCYGGRVRTLEHAMELNRLGVEKISLSQNAIARVGLVADISRVIGAQSVVVTLDIRSAGFVKRKYEVMVGNGRRTVKSDFLDLIMQFQDCGAGEIVLNCIDRDGSKKGFDTTALELALSVAQIPITLLGGCSSDDDIKDLARAYPGVGIGVGSHFVLTGDYDAVLIRYPSLEERRSWAAS